MAANKVTIVDYGIGNLFSVSRALEKCGAEVVLSATPEGILAADRLVLPGVGAFARGMRGLREQGLVEPLREYAKRGRPLLGICLGMQMLFERSTEFGDHEGLGFIPGRIAAIEPGLDETGAPVKVPHIGWSPLLKPEACRTWDGTILQRLQPGATTYFVHSYTAEPAHEEHRLADAQYGASRISAAVRKDHISGCQFHPEKSGANGLAIVRSFLEA
jgi:glutamine amidotransferase